MHASRTSQMALLGLVLAAAGCAGSGRAAPATALVVPESTAQPAVVDTPLVPCPSPEEVTELAVDTARIPAPATPLLLQCREGRFPRPGWVLIADSNTLEHVAVIDAQTRAVLATRTEITSSPNPAGEKKVMLELAEVTDLDSDGIDELVQLWRAAGENSAVQTLVVERLEAGNLAIVLSRQVGWVSLPAGERCVASVAVGEPDPDGKRRVLTSVAASGPDLQPEQCAGAVYELTDGALVDVTPHETAAEDSEPYDFEDTTAPGPQATSDAAPNAAPAATPASQDGQADEDDAGETSSSDEYDIEY